MKDFQKLFESSHRLTESIDKQYTLGGSCPSGIGKIVALNEENGWYIYKMTIEEAAKQYGDTVENFISQYGYDYSTPIAMYVGVDIEMEQSYGIGEGEGAVVGIQWENGTYAHYGMRDDSDECDKTEMFKSIVVSGMMKDYSTPAVKESKSAKHVHRIVKESVFGKDIHGNSITAKSLEGGSVEELISLYPDIKFTVVGNGSMADCITKVSNGHYRILTDDPEVNPDLAYIRGYKASAEEITQFKDTVRSSLIQFFNRYRMTQVSEQQVDDIIETALQKHLLPGGWVLKNLSAVVPRITKSARDAGEVWIYFGFKRVGTEERIPVDFPLKVTKY